MSNLIGVLQGLGFKVTYAASNLEAPEPYVSRLQSQAVEVLYRPYVRSLETHLASQGGRYDLAILSRADAASAIMPAVRRHCSKARVIFDTVDLHFLREFRLAELTGDASIQKLAERRKAQELELVDAADVTLVVSDAEREVLRTLRPSAHVELVSNIHHSYGSPTPFEARRDCLFIGAFAHPPNRDAVLWLAREILPLVRAEIPELRCHVIGADPPAEVRALGTDWLFISGYVPDVEPFFDACRLSVAPLRYGAGVKGKINQSLAHGLPVVTTSQGAEGMYLRDGESALIADDPSAFAAAMVRLYQDSKLWQRLSVGGLAVMETHFSFEAARQALLGAIRA
jgi:glycosyltransferase involved in cell wall biosynthesis